MRVNPRLYIVEGLLLCILVISLALYPQETQPTLLPEVETWNDAIITQAVFELTPENSSFSFSIDSAPGGDATAKILCQSSSLSNSSFCLSVSSDNHNTNFTDMTISNGSQQVQIFRLSNDHGDYHAPVTFNLSLTPLSGYVQGSIVVIGIKPGYKIYGPMGHAIPSVIRMLLSLVFVVTGIVFFFLTLYLIIRRIKRPPF